jgi:signal transduction histidine kinase
LGVNKHADPTKIDAGIHKPDERTLRDVGGHIRNSTKRMAALIDDMLDLAKGRIGGGFSLDRNPDAPFMSILNRSSANYAMCLKTGSKPI